MKLTKEKWLLIALFLIVLAIRLFFVFNQSGFTYEAYETIRQAEHIQQTGIPLFQDSLSYSGRMYITLPFFNYVLAGVAILISLPLAAKLLPTIFFSFIPIVVFFITKHLSKNKIASFVAALFSGFVPIFFSTIGDVSVNSLALLLIFWLTYAFIKLEKPGYDTLALILMIMLLLTNSLALVLFLALILYFFMLRIEQQKISKRKLELSLFLFFLGLWFNIILFKKALLMHGTEFIWRNLPATMLAQFFTEISLGGILYAIGIIPLLLGVVSVYQILFKTKNRIATLYLAFTIISALMLWLKILPFNEGLMILSINLIILSSVSMKTLFVALSKTKFIWLSKAALIILLILFLVTTMVPLVTAPNPEKPPINDVKALEWLKDNSEEGSVILGRIKEGHMISQIAERKNVADTNFLLIKNVDEIYEDIETAFVTRWESDAIRIMNRYDVDYVFLSEQTKKDLKIDELFYAESECFEKIYEYGATIYKFKECTLE